MIFISWLKNYASELGSKLPFMSHSTANPVIRLPFPNKRMVWKLYEATYCVDEDLKPLDYPTFTKVWKHSPELRFIKLSKHKEGFAKCDTCLEYKQNTKKQLGEGKRAQLDSDYLAHVMEFMGKNRNIMLLEQKLKQSHTNT